MYLDGFAERSKIKVDLEIPDDFGRLSQELETAIFRIVQDLLPTFTAIPEALWPQFIFTASAAVSAWKSKTEARAYRQRSDLRWSSAWHGRSWD